MRIWIQLVSSPTRLPNFLAALQKHADSIVAPGTEVSVRGTEHGALGDHYAHFLHFDADEILRLAHREVRGADYAVYALANSLDPALDALRELLDVPVLSIMQVGCGIATMVGDSFGVCVPNAKIQSMYTRMIGSYGLGDRLAAVGHLGFDRIADQDRMFTDEAAAEQNLAAVHEVARGLVRAGAETLLVPGPSGLLLSNHGVREIDGAPIVDLYTTLIKISESVAFLADRCGLATSRVLRYQQPPEQLVAEAARIYEF
jgi:allantoin racemase